MLMLLHSELTDFEIDGVAKSKKIFFQKIWLFIWGVNGH